MLKKVICFAVVLVMGAFLFASPSKEIQPSLKPPVAIFIGSSAIVEIGVGATWLCFYSDGTFELCGSGVESFNFIVLKGAYSGDPTKNGLMRLTVTHAVDMEEKTLQAIDTSESIVIPISGGKTCFMGIIFSR